jgi:LmeA-like phospholipid-binding
MPEETSPTNSLNKIGIITKVLTAAIKLWLRTQVSQVSQIEVEIRASDRQILSGSIPWVSIFASHAVYQGLHITRIQLVAENIQINVGQVLKGQPLKLLQVISVFGEMTVEEKDLNNSLSSELLSTALNNVLLELLPEHWLKSQPISWQKIILDNNQIILNALLTPASKPISLEVYLGLELLNGSELQLGKVQVMQNEVALVEGNYDYTLDLGSDVDIQELSLIPGKLVCQGRINVNP